MVEGCICEDGRVRERGLDGAVDLLLEMLCLEASLLLVNLGTRSRAGVRASTALLIHNAGPVWRKYVSRFETSRMLPSSFGTPLHEFFVMVRRLLGDGVVLTRVSKERSMLLVGYLA